MEQGIKIVLTVVGLLLVAFGVVYLLSDRILNLNEQAEIQEDRSSEGFSSMKCILNGGEYYTKQLTCSGVCNSNGGLGIINDDFDGVNTDGDCGFPPLTVGWCCCTGPAIKGHVVSIPTCKGDCGSAKSVVTTNCPSIGAAIDICCCRCG
ncbi:MAG: hypothetical protein KAQ92_05255 [Candidatus Aenigmarchaeota archaeon]|nr:hypothetical protein [Candidatus Aenigmarchaeota archaeon]